MSSGWSSAKITLLSVALALLVWRAAATAGGGQVAVSSTPAQRQQFVAAMQRVRQHLPDEQDSPDLKTYVIYDYLLAARLRRDLQAKPDEQLDSAIDNFLKAHDGQPVARNLRVDWLAHLATRHRWDWFLPRAAEVTTPQLLCDRLAGYVETGDTKTIAAEALTRWGLPQKQPTECDPVFAWLHQQGLITPALAESRARTALAADNPRLSRDTFPDLPAERLAPLQLWAHLLEAPKAALTELAADQSAAVEPVALISGFDRLARGDSASAEALLPQLLSRPDMTPAMQTHLHKIAAMGAAFSRDSTAVAAFDGLPADIVDSDVLEWRVRAALWAGDYRKALSWIEQMPASLAGQPRWRYWHARAVEATAGKEAAAPLFAELAGLRDFYGYLAADRVGRGYDLNAKASADDTATQNVLAADAGLIRAHALFDCDLEDDAATEWAAVVGGANPTVKLQAAHLAARWGWYSQSIITLAQVGEFDDVRLRYPRPFPEAVSQASKLTQLPADWILAVMRQESLFRDDAVSRAGARGLMQMQPHTAAAVARRWHLPPPPHDGPADPTADVARGAAHLRDLMDKYGQLGLTLAAYNAGSVPVARWLPNRPMDADVWIENIPYGETRTYVEHTVEHIVAFAWVRESEPPRLATLLPPVTPAAAAAQAAQR